MSKVKVTSALEALYDYALYKSTFTLHYITFTQGHTTFQQQERHNSVTGRNINMELGGNIRRHQYSLRHTFKVIRLQTEQTEKRI